MKNSKMRIEILDELRGFAIIAMIVHHFFLDIYSVLGFEWGVKTFNKLCAVQPLFWGIFIIISGICSRLSRNAAKRGAIVLGCGIGITVVTAVIMPLLGFGGSEIYFGILSCLGSCMIIAGALMPLIKKINPFAGMSACAVLFAFFFGIDSGTLCFGAIKLPEASNNLLMPLGIYTDDFESADYFGILPWLFLFLFGSFCGKFFADGALPKQAYKRRSKFFAFVGRNSLWLYLAHQPVLYALMYAFLGLLKIYVVIKT